MKPLPFREVVRRLKAAGFSEASQSGSHIKFARAVDQETRTAIVPKHKEVAAGTPRGILRQAGLGESDFEKL